DLADALALGDEPREVRGLVLLALAADQVGLRVLGGRLRHLIPRDVQLEGGQVLAGEERRQVAWRQRQIGARELHVRESVTPGPPSYFSCPCSDHARAPSRCLGSSR